MVWSSVSNVEKPHRVALSWCLRNILEIACGCSILFFIEKYICVSMWVCVYTYIYTYYDVNKVINNTFIQPLKKKKAKT